MTPSSPTKESLVLFCSAPLTYTARGDPLTHGSAGGIPASRLWGRNPFTVRLFLNEEWGETWFLRLNCIPPLDLVSSLKTPLVFPVQRISPLSSFRKCCVVLLILNTIINMQPDLNSNRKKKN
jgi:hypothetical protein